MSMLHRLRATKRALSTDENSGDHRVKKPTKKTTIGVNPIIISRFAIFASPPSSPSTPAFPTETKLHLAAAKHPRVLAIWESEVRFGKTMVQNRQTQNVVRRASPLAKGNCDLETTAAKKGGFPAEGGAEDEGVGAGLGADWSSDGMGGGEQLGLRGQGEDGDVEMADAKGDRDMHMV